MDRLQGNDLKLACGVIIDRYKACIKNSLVYDVLGKGDVNAPTRKCGSMFADITEYCGSYVRPGDVQAPDAHSASGNSNSSGGAAGRNTQ